jgi:hypothetical protein
VQDQLSNTVFGISFLVLLVLSIFGSFFSSVIVYPGPYDVEWFVDAALEIKQGNWLGPYDSLTLIRQPLYPLFLAAGSWLNLRLPLLQHALLLLSFTILLLALRQSGITRTRSLVIFGLLALHPLTFLLPKLIGAEVLELPLLVMIAASCFGIYASYPSINLKFISWLLTLSIATAVFCHIRLEGIWVLSVVPSLVVLLLVKQRKFLPKLSTILVLTVPLVLVLTVKSAISFANSEEYGVYTNNDLAEKHFTEAMKTLTRISPEQHRRYVPVTRAAFSEAFAASPSFAELQPFLTDQLDGGAWLQYGCDYMGVCDEISGGWLVWAIRDAAAERGHHRSATDASNYYRAVAGELGSACDNSVIPCTVNPTGHALAPPMKIQYVPGIALSSIKWFFNAALSQAWVPALDAVSGIQPSDELVDRFAALTHAAEIDDRNDPIASSTHFYAYSILQFAGLIVVFSTALIRGARVFRSRNLTRAFLADTLETYWPAWLLMVVIMTRCGLVAYVDIMSFTATHRYVVTLYPLLILLIGINFPTPGSSKIKEG